MRLFRVHRIMGKHLGNAPSCIPECQRWESDPGAGSKRPLVVSDQQGGCFCDFQ